jgi:hypothetical protein
MALGGVDSITVAVGKFRAAIEERGLTTAYADSVGDTMAEIDFALERLVPRLKGGNAEWTPRDVEVYRFFLAAKIDELKSLAKEKSLIVPAVGLRTVCVASRPYSKKSPFSWASCAIFWSGREDSNLRPLGPEPSALPD